MYNYNTSSHVVQPLFDLQPISPKAARKDGKPVGASARDALCLLTNAHISPQVVSSRVNVGRDKSLGKLEVWPNGSLIKVSKPAQLHSGGGRRGVVVGFTRGSRRRIFLLMAKLLRSALPLFVTLTYPAAFSTDYTQWKRDLDKWARRVHRRYPSVGFIWRLEPQRRGAPHYHLLMFGLPDSPEVKVWIARSWFEVVKSGDGKHLEWGTHVEQIRSRRGVNAYAGKYIGKLQLAALSEDVDWTRVGRWWGVRYPENLPFADKVGGDMLTFKEAAVLMRFFRRYLKGQGVKVNSQLPGMVVFVADPGRWLDQLDRLLRGGS